MLYGSLPFSVDSFRFYGQQESALIYEEKRRGFNVEVTENTVLISKESKDLMMRLMELDANKRLTAKEALKHSWIINNDNLSFDDDNKSQNNDDNTIKVENTCLISMLFKNAIAYAFKDKYRKMKPKYFHDLLNIFRKLDDDNDGIIKYESFKSGLFMMKDLRFTKNDIIKLFEQEVDAQKICGIGYESLVTALIHDYLADTDQRLHELCRSMDEYENGKVKTIDLKKKFVEMNIYGNANELIKIIDDLDLDKCGYIDYEWFIRALNPDLNQIPKWFYNNND